MLTRRNFIKTAIFTATLPTISLLTGCDDGPSDQEVFTCIDLDGFWVMTYATNKEKETIIVRKYADGYYRYKIDLESGCLKVAGKVGNNWEAVEKYFGDVETESLSRLLIKTHGYKESYSIEEVKTVVDNFKTREKQK